jgi:hypothetical protein
MQKIKLGKGWGQSKEPCPRCKQNMWVMQKTGPTPAQVNKGFWHRLLFYCRNRNCETTYFGFARHRVSTTAIVPTKNDIEHDARRRRHERKIGNYSQSVRPNPNVPIGWPSDGRKPPWEE